MQNNYIKYDQDGAYLNQEAEFDFEEGMKDLSNDLKNKDIKKAQKQVKRFQSIYLFDPNKYSDYKSSSKQTNKK